ncbi:hypothetical protein PTSG_08417 [Salpingoeca rosetta]|uniref:Uncharacterized protein n=1 Tax=Salpingoeca rosetta (strain ATCC 50818 / BSB-021) TaxID=946362 RepID=F2UJM4_SALR5|nr:uncharacterized protein PTSG_08417 [Salpingoeca rosetta]EGD77323.1 hypothetical protein PTSG_08417 [Salpingoeca rosetta]|eukprot:XP_004990667.1 hypothetical protein PTSG_08417 [Salpingoeca rosetta]
MDGGGGADVEWILPHVSFSQVTAAKARRGAQQQAGTMNSIIKTLQAAAATEGDEDSHGDGPPTPRESLKWTLAANPVTMEACMSMSPLCAQARQARRAAVLEMQGDIANWRAQLDAARRSPTSLFDDANDNDNDDDDDDGDDDGHMNERVSRSQRRRRHSKGVHHVGRVSCDDGNGGGYDGGGGGGGVGVGEVMDDEDSENKRYENVPTSQERAHHGGGSTPSSCHSSQSQQHAKPQPQPQPLQPPQPRLSHKQPPATARIPHQPQHHQHQRAVVRQPQQPQQPQHYEDTFRVSTAHAAPSASSLPSSQNHRQLHHHATTRQQHSTNAGPSQAGTESRKRTYTREEIEAKKMKAMINRKRMQALRRKRAREQQRLAHTAHTARQQQSQHLYASASQQQHQRQQHDSRPSSQQQPPQLPQQHRHPRW